MAVLLEMIKKIPAASRRGIKNPEYRSQESEWRSLTASTPHLPPPLVAANARIYSRSQQIPLQSE